MKIKQGGEKFAAAHPRFLRFLQVVAEKGVQVGGVLDVTLTAPDGEQIQSNIRLSQEDVDFIKELMALKDSAG